MSGTRMKIAAIALASLAAVSISGTANAASYGTVIANELDDGSPIGGSVTGSLDSGSTTNPGGGGLFLFNRLAGGTSTEVLLPDSPPGRFTAFCLEFNEDLNGGDNTYDLVDLFEAPVDAKGTIDGGMGQPKANLIASILGNVFPGGAPSTAAEDVALGVQIAIWEIVHETSGSYDVAGGTARWATDVAGALAKATTYLANISAGGEWLGDYTTAALKLKAIVSQKPSANDQDFVVWTGSDGETGEVPLPAAAWLLLSGLAGLGVVSRRRKTA